MTLEEAIKDAESRSRNINLHWFVCEWNNEFCINSSSFMRRFPDTKYVYSTGELNRSWSMIYDEGEKRFKHVVKLKGIKYYCDDQRHLVCIPYSIENLHKMADDLGIKRCWFHNKKGREHYDIPKKRINEIHKKCNVVSPMELLKIIKGEDGGI